MTPPQSEALLLEAGGRSPVPGAPARLAALLERAAQAPASLGAWDCGEVRRVLALPPREAPPPGRWSVALRRHPAAPPLRPAQEDVLEELHRAPRPLGVFASVGVGHGKTLIALLAGVVAGAERPLVCVPPAMVAPLGEAARQWAPHYPVPEAPAVLSYAALSAPDAGEVLERLAPDLLILDEAQALRHPRSARALRVVRYLEAHPACRVVVLSGTVTGQGLMDHAHLLRWALRERAPVPLDYRRLQEWAAVLDPRGEPDHATLAGFWPLVDALGGPPWALLTPQDRQATARGAYRAHLLSRAGVVATTEPSTDAPLALEPLAVEWPGELAQAVADLEERGELPEVGAEGEDPPEGPSEGAHLAALARALCVGFYYAPDWTAHRATGRPGPDPEWLETRAAWAAAVAGLRGARVGWDSPANVERRVRHHGPTAGRGRLGAAWEALVAWDRLRHHPGPEPRAVWVSRAVVRAVVERADRLASRGEPPVVWYSSRAVGEALAQEGLAVHGQGSPPPRYDGGPVACAVAVHGTGQNLQAYNRAIVLEPPAGGAAWEQLIGRHHRQGQGRPVVVEVALLGGPQRRALAAAAEKARYIEQTTGSPQRLLGALDSLGPLG